MTVGRIDMFDRDGRIRNYEAWRLYALFCMKSDSEAVVKIGVSSIIYDRIAALMPGLLYPIGVVLHAPVGERGHTMFVESQVHKAFKSRRTRGEWFEFDLSSKDDKQMFHGEIKRIYQRYVQKDLVWTKILPEQISAYVTMKAKKAKSKAKRVA